MIRLTSAKFAEDERGQADEGGRSAEPRSAALIHFFSFVGHDGLTRDLFIVLLNRY